MVKAKTNKTGAAADKAVKPAANKTTRNAPAKRAARKPAAKRTSKKDEAVYCGLTREQLAIGVRYSIHHMVAALKKLTEAERMAMLSNELSLQSWKFACEQFSGLCLLTSMWVQELNSDHKRLGTPTAVGTPLFSPITGRTENKMFIGDIDVDVMSDVSRMPDSQQAAERQMHDAQQEAVNFIIDMMTGKEDGIDPPEVFAKKFAQDLGLKIASIDIERIKRCDDDEEEGEDNA